MLIPVFLSPLSDVFSKDNSKSQFHSIADKTEYVKQLKALLASKDFRERIKGIDQLVADCKENPYMVMCNMFPVMYSGIFHVFIYLFCSDLRERE